MKILIVDDELDVLKGLKKIIQWFNLGLTVCGEALDGIDALQKIQILKPDLVLMDIRMPGMSGLEIIRQCREFHFQGHFIILSGYSDFKYAQSAVKLGVNNYLLKPVDEDELRTAILDIQQTLQTQNRKEQMLNKYRENARTTIIMNLITGNEELSTYDMADLNLITDQYMIILAQRYEQGSFQPYWNFSDLLRVSNQNHSSYEHMTMEHLELILLKGTEAIQKFYHVLEHYSHGLQEGSPLDSLFLIYSHPVSYISELKNAYQDALTLLNRRFFCNEKQHILSYSNLPDKSKLASNIMKLQEYPSILAGYIQAHNRSRLAEALRDLENLLYYSDDDVISLKHSLTDIFLQVKQIICNTYHTIQIPFPGNAAIIDFITGKYYLYEIIQFFSEQFEMCINAIGSPTSQNIMDDILYYINHNYAENLKLESIAPLFGYNSSYLGKLFSQNVGESFNSYLDSLRIRTAQKMLAENTFKIYEISEKIGYKNTDYFHKKFKKYTNMTPAEYRKYISEHSDM